jgi:hypothetical protein
MTRRTKRVIKDEYTKNGLLFFVSILFKKIKQKIKGKVSVKRFI